MHTTKVAAELLETIRGAAQNMGAQRLTQSEFCSVTGISANQILRHFDSWSEACKAAGVECGSTGRENLRPNPRIDEATCIAEMKRVAELLGAKALSKRDFEQHATFHSGTVLARFGRWERALKAAGLQEHENHRHEIPLLVLAAEFLNATVQLRRIPTVRHVVRRSQHCLNSFTRKWGSYKDFKKQAIGCLLSGETTIDPEIRALLETEARRLNPETLDPFKKRSSRFIRAAHCGFGLLLSNRRMSRR